MRRPNRSIEVFDISLMAVVTKAMGAFLVLMLLLMPYYSSGPIGEQRAAELAKQLEEAQAKIKSISGKIGRSSEDPDELRKALDDLQRQLADAQRTMSLLKRDNDALNAQVRRLEDRSNELAAERDSLQERLDAGQQPVITGRLTNWSCFDVRLEVGIIEKGRQLAVGDPSKQSYLNFNWMFGEFFTMTDEDIARMNRETGQQPGRRLSYSSFRAQAYPGLWAVAIVSKSKNMRSVHDLAFRPLRRPASDCRVLLDFAYYLPRKKEAKFFSLPTQEITFPKNNEILIVDALTVTAGDVAQAQISAENMKWLLDQQKLAEVEVPPSPPTPAPSPPALDQETRERIRQQAIERRQELERLRRQREQQAQPERSP